MKSEIVHSLTRNFEDHAQKTENGIEFWLARDLQHLLGYSEWRNFVNKAKAACEVSEQPVDDHFVGANKMIKWGSASAGKSLLHHFADVGRMIEFVPNGEREMAIFSSLISFLTRDRGMAADFSFLNSFGVFSREVS